MSCSATIDADLLTALDPVTFAEGLDFYPDDWQAQVLRFAGKRLILNCSRQSGKSTCCALKALHQALYLPGQLILLVSPSLRQSMELFRVVLRFLAQIEGVKRIEDNRLSVQFANQSRIISLPSSEGTIRGFAGCTLLLLDEASRIQDELYAAVRPMLAVSNGSLILLSTPHGKIGFFYESWVSEEPWERIRVPAGEVSRISEEFLKEERAALGHWHYLQEYETEFLEAEDAVFLYDIIERAFVDIPPLFEEDEG